MPSTYSPDLRIELIGAGDQAGTWNTTTNTNLGTLIEDAISGAITVSVAATPRALTALNGAVDESRQATLILTTALAVPFTVYAPPVSKQYVIYNNTAYVATIGNATVANGVISTGGTTIAIPAGKVVTVWSDGNNFAWANTSLPGATISATSVTNTPAGNIAAVTVQAALNELDAEKALLAGSVAQIFSAPTAAPGTNTTQVATTAFVNNVAGALGTMSSQNANAVVITGGTITGTTVNGVVVGTNASGARTVSSASPSGGSNGDIWYMV